jgi:hypothetical protein
MAYLDDAGGDSGGPITTPVGGGIFQPGGAVSTIAGAFFGPSGTRVVEGVNAFFGGIGGGAPPGYTTQLEGGGTSTTYGDITYGGGGGGGGGGGWRAGSAASVRSVIPRFLEGAAIAASVYEAYRLLRSRGMGHAAAKRAAHRMHGIFHKRRRMRVGNTRAIRRAIRRVHGARKMFSKIRGLMGVHHHAMGGGGWHRGRGRKRRGDLYESVENEQDTIDDLLDDGYTPEEIADFFGGIGA